MEKKNLLLEVIFDKKISANTNQFYSNFASWYKSILLRVILLADKNQFYSE